MALEPGQLRNTMFGPMPGPGSRYYSLGAILTHVSPSTGGKHRVSAQYDFENGNGKSTFLSDIYGDGRLRIQGQLVDARADSRTEWGLTTTLRGEDYVLVNRVKHSKEIGLSYNQRIAPGSPLTLGGEIFFNYPALRQIGNPSKADETATNSKPLEYAVGCAYDNKVSKTAVHLATTNSFSNILSLHHLFRVSDRSSLAAKFMCTPTLGTSMASAGYRVKFRNTLTTVTGVVDTYGTVRLLVEKEPVKDFRVSASMDARIGPQAQPGPDGTTTLGFRVIVGTPSPIVAPLSPCTMSRDIFSAA